MSQQRITRIMVQSCPRADSITALYLLTQTLEGRKKYPGVENAVVEFWGTGTMSPDGLTWKEYLEKGTILIGVGGGPFDEHPNLEFGDRKDQQLSATLLVARDLGLNKHMLYRKLVKTTTENDLNPVRSEDVLANIVKLMHRMEGGMSPTEIIGWAYRALDAMIDNQHQFIKALREYEFSEELNLKTIERPDGTKVVLAFIRSDSRQMWKAAGYRNKRLAVLIQRRKSGRVQIFANPNLGVRTHQVARALRHAELMVRNRLDDAVENLAMLDQPGQLPLVPQWCYQMPGQNLLNGSETACDIEPTKLSDEWIRQIVLDNIEFAHNQAEPIVEEETAEV